MTCIIWMFLFLLSFCEVTKSVNHCHSTPPAEEVQSVLDLYYSTDGASWINQWPVSQNSSNNPCDYWFGINCEPRNNGSQCHVTDLNLVSNNLKGLISPTIGNLTYLELLVLNDNSLQGRIPESIGNLIQLTNLFLFNNELSSSIPNSLCKLTQIIQLALSQNFLTGTIPACIGNLSSLENLDLHDNKLMGSIPETVGSLAQLTYLTLSSNHLTGTVPASVGNMVGLSFLTVDNNKLTGTIPSSLCNASNLEGFYLYTNDLSGSIPPCIGNLLMLKYIGIFSNHLTGTIPASACDLSLLYTFDLYENDLSGSIPSCIGRLPKLFQLYIYNNFLTGTIPSSIGNLSAMEFLYLYSNLLSGSIPPSVGNLSQLQALALFGNQLNGTIPSSLGQLPLLKYMHLENNQLTGTIPSSLGSLSTLQNLDLNSNALIGGIPATFGMLQRMQYLTLYGNKLTGSIPDTIGNATSLFYIDIDSNLLTGSIPSTMGQLTQLQYIYLYNNRLNGSIPSEIGNMTELQYMFVQNNQLTGTIPTTIASMHNLVGLGIGSNVITFDDSLILPVNISYIDASNCSFSGRLSEWFLRQPLTYLDLSFNHFQGSLPSEIWNTSVKQLFLNNNEFVGTFPAKRNTAVCLIEYLSVSNNFMSGSLPDELSQCMNLTSFAAANMFLSGGIDGLFASQPNLAQIVLSNNSLSGPIEDIFQSSTASNLIFNAAYNQFSGSLPMSSLSQGQFQSLILTENCLSGSLTAKELCLNVNMTYLLLSGLHAASSCRSNAFSLSSSLHIYSSYLESSAFGGSLPGCVLSLPRLTFLALSGNHLTGSLPSSIQLAETLQGLDLSHNNLVGTIPDTIFDANLTLLDLSFNRLSGTISASATSYYADSNTSQVSLQVNALSGSLPASWVYANDINVLEGNLFACKEGSLSETANNPIHDPYSAHYACGSSQTNVSLLSVTVIGIFLGLAMAFMYIVSRRKQGENFYHRCQGLRELLLVETRSCVALLKGHLRIVLAVIALLVLCMVVYAGVSLSISAYTEMYIWVISLSLQEGVVAGVVLFLWLCFTCTCLIVMSSSTLSTRACVVSLSSMDQISICMFCKLEHLYFLGSLLKLLCMHVIPVFAINMLYVYTTTLVLPDQQRTAIALSMAVFKLGWNSGMNRLALTNKSTEWMLSVVRYIGLFNLIISPLLTEVLVSPNCFQYLFSAIPVNSYFVDGGSCYWITYVVATSNPYGATFTTQQTAFPCMTYSNLQETYNSGSSTRGNSNMNIASTTTSGQSSTINYQAGFAYNYQCTFSLLQAFVYVFLYRYIFGIFVLPLLWIMLKRLQSYTFSQYSASHWLCRITTFLLPPLMRMYDTTLSSSASSSSSSSVEAERQAHNAVLLRDFALQEKPKLTAILLTMRMVSDVAVALSFGVLFPPLGLLAICSVLSELWWTKWMIQRLRSSHCSDISTDNRKDQESTVPDSSNLGVHYSVDRKNETGVPASNVNYSTMLSQFINQLEQVYAKQVPEVVTDTPMILSFAVVLWAFALYDIVGRETGTIRSLWVVFLVLTMPVWCRLQVWIWRSMICPAWGINNRNDSVDVHPNPDHESYMEMSENPLQSTDRTISSTGGAK